MYRRYVDDILVCLDPLRKGWEYNKVKNKMEYKENVITNDSDEKRTMKTLMEVADSIDQNIQFTTDSPENHIDGRMPVLDLKVWVSNGKLLHSFYKKEVASEYTILERSAMSMGTKRNTIFQKD